jgi:hypothetical protein
VHRNGGRHIWPCRRRQQAINGGTTAQAMDCLLAAHINAQPIGRTYGAAIVPDLGVGRGDLRVMGAPMAVQPVAGMGKAIPSQTLLQHGLHFTIGKAVDYG